MSLRDEKTRERKHLSTILFSYDILLIYKLHESDSSHESEEVKIDILIFFLPVVMTRNELISILITHKKIKLLYCKIIQNKPHE